jgi:proteic killer suppression protein
MIHSFANSETERVWLRERVKRWPLEIQRVAYRKLLILDAAEFLHDLRIPPGNRLQALSGNRKGQHSVRINDQWRICFKWTKLGAEAVEIVDYH